MQTSVEKMIRAGNDRYRQIERLRPGKDVIHGDRCISRTMNDQGVFGYGMRRILPGTVDVTGRHSDQHHALDRLAGSAHGLGHARLYVGAEGEASQSHRQFTENTSRLVKYDQHILSFAISPIVLAFAPANTSKIRANYRVTEPDEGAGERMCNLVLIVAAE